MPARVYVPHACLVLRDQKGTLDFLELGKTDGCELSCGCWESNPGPLQKQQLLFTTESPLAGVQTVSLEFCSGLEEKTQLCNHTLLAAGRTACVHTACC